MEHTMVGLLMLVILGGIGVLFNRVNNHCFYTPTQKYATT